MFVFSLMMLLLCVAALAEQGPFSMSRIRLAALGYAAMGGGVLAAWRLGSARVQRRVLWVIWLLLCTEAIAQLLSAGSLIPGVSIWENAPLGRVSWTVEGRHSGVMNGWGWHARRRTFSGDKRRVVIIGDSFIEALEVSRSDSVAPRLEALLGDHEVLPLGRGATGPGHYLEALHYAVAHHQPDDIIVSFFLGNDFTDSYGRSTSSRQLDHELMYGITPDGTLFVHPSTQIEPATYQHRLHYNHYLTPLTVVRAMLSHHLMLGLGEDLWMHSAKLASPPLQQRSSTVLPTERISHNDSMRLAVRLLQELRDQAARSGARLMVVTVPHFPQVLYNNPPDTVPDLSRYGLLADELALLAAIPDVPSLPLGARLREARLTVEEIRALYINGVGHLTPSGHAWFAAELRRAFYDPPPGAAQ